ncbi:ROK family transcriptional regulator [Arthrobacter sp. CJ23]|uniref:ROK family transcriptional regulator n=1 Tax=Arthrobacter sp. CJ23 TaxID=2972479 RepID=UPI00215D1E87|nr:ROK family protein [Arthrobacter sp. CJ23]UVJ38629.1 ROK family protein [Arthrobacter sp. CJ23]
MSKYAPDVAGRPSSRDTVLAYAWDAGEFTAGEALENVGLTRSTTIEALDALVEIGLLKELPNARVAGKYRTGRPSRRFCLRSTAGVVVGVDAGREHLAVKVADFGGTELSQLRQALDPEHDSAEERRSQIDAAVGAALSQAGRSRSEVLAICAGVPAPVDRHGRSPVHPDGFWGRMNPDLVDLLAEWAPLVRVDNDASLAAVAEGKSGAAAGCNDYVALLAGARLGSGVVVDGRLLRGAHGGVGEMIAFDHVVGVGAAHGLGHRAAEWARDAIAAGAVDPNGAMAQVPPESLDGRAVLELAAQGDPDAGRVVARVGAMLARVVSVLGSMYDPQRVIICGAVSAGVSSIVEAARRALPDDLHLPAPDIMVSELGADVVVQGAVTAAGLLAKDHALDIWHARSEARASS